MSAKGDPGWGGYQLPRAGMITDNRAGDRLILVHPKGVFELMRVLNPFETAAFVSRHPSGVRHIVQAGACVLTVPEHDLGMRAKDFIGKWETGQLYLTRRLSASDAYPIFADLHGRPDTELILGGMAAEAVSEILRGLHPIRQAMRTPTRKRQGSARGAAWHLSRGRDVPPLRVLVGGAA